MRLNQTLFHVVASLRYVSTKTPNNVYEKVINQTSGKVQTTSSKNVKQAKRTKEVTLEDAALSLLALSKEITKPQNEISGSVLLRHSAAVAVLPAFGKKKETGMNYPHLATEALTEGHRRQLRMERLADRSNEVETRFAALEEDREREAKKAADELARLTGSNVGQVRGDAVREKLADAMRLCDTAEANHRPVVLVGSKLKRITWNDGSCSNLKSFTPTEKGFSNDNCGVFKYNVSLPPSKETPYSLVTVLEQDAEIKHPRYLAVEAPMKPLCVSKGDWPLKETSSNANKRPVMMKQKDLPGQRPIQTSPAFPALQQLARHTMTVLDAQLREWQNLTPVKETPTLNISPLPQKQTMKSNVTDDIFKDLNDENVMNKLDELLQGMAMNNLASTKPVVSTPTRRMTASETDLLQLFERGRHQISLQSSHQSKSLQQGAAQQMAALMDSVNKPYLFPLSDNTAMRSKLIPVESLPNVAHIMVPGRMMHLVQRREQDQTLTQGMAVSIGGHVGFLPLTERYMSPTSLEIVDKFTCDHGAVLHFYVVEATLSHPVQLQRLPDDELQSKDSPYLEMSMPRITLSLVPPHSGTQVWREAAQRLNQLDEKVTLVESEKLAHTRKMKQSAHAKKGKKILETHLQSIRDAANVSFQLNA